MLLVNALIIMVCFWIILHLNSHFIQPALWNKRRFKLFELRDRLAILAMQGRIDETSMEYITLIDLLNAAVNETRHFEVVNFLRFLYKLKNDSCLQSKIDKILDTIDVPDIRFRTIIFEYFDVMHSILHTKTRILNVCLAAILTVVQLFKVLTSIANVLNRKKNLLILLDQDLEDKKKRSFAAA